MTSIGAAAVPQYLMIEKNETAAVSRFAQTDATARNTLSAFKKSAPSIRSASDLMGNYKALTVVLGAYGLSSLVGQKAVVRDLLTQNPSSPQSLAAKSGNAAWQKLAKAFADWSSSPLSTQSGIDTIAQQYMTSSFETNQNTQTPGLGNALYFARTMTSSMNLAQIMSDPTLLKVVETVSGYDPTQFGALDYNQQVHLLSSSVDLSSFSSPDKIQRYAEQYLAILQFHPAATTTPASMLTLYGSSGANSGILSLFGASSSSVSLFSSLF